MKKFRAFISCLLSIPILISSFSILAVFAESEEAGEFDRLKAAWCDITMRKTELYAIPKADQRNITSENKAFTDKERSSFGKYYSYSDGSVSQLKYTGANGSSFKSYSQYDNVVYTAYIKFPEKGKVTYKFYTNGGSKWYPQWYEGYWNGEMRKASTNASSISEDITGFAIEDIKTEVYAGCIFVTYDAPLELPTGYESFTASDWISVVYNTDFTGFNVTDEFKAAFAEVEAMTAEGKAVSELKSSYSVLSKKRTELYAIPSGAVDTSEYSDISALEAEKLGDKVLYIDGSKVGNYEYVCVGDSWDAYSELKNVKFSVVFKYVTSGDGVQLKVLNSKYDISWSNWYHSPGKNTLREISVDFSDINSAITHIQVWNQHATKLYIGGIYVSWEEPLEISENFEMLSAVKTISTVYSTDFAEIAETDKLSDCISDLKPFSIAARCDVNSDCDMNSKDLAALRQLLLGASEMAETAGDITGNGTTDIIDLVRLKKLIAVGIDKNMNGENDIMKLSFVTDEFKVNEKIEIKADISGISEELNVFDENDVDLTISLTSEKGTVISLPGFYYEEYEFSDEGALIGRTRSAGDFRFRISLPEAGEWKYIITLKIEGERTDTASGSITVENNFSNAGVIGVEQTQKQNFVFSDGTPFVAIGENICYANDAAIAESGSGTRGAKMIEWMKKCADNGANFTRIWFIQWFLSIQKNGCAPDDLSKGMGDAAQYDRMFEAWEETGMYGQLCLFSFNQLKSTTNEGAWNCFPYNAATANGYLEKPEDFFTDERAIADTKSYIRYLIARYSYSTNLFAWEFFNEVDGTDNSGSNVDAIVNWHKEMTDYIRSLVPYGHMITTSTACYPGNADPNDSELKNKLNAQDIFDFASIHTYNYSNIRHIEDYQKKFSKLYNRPVVYGECGITSVYLDEDLVTFHQQNWMGVMGGGAGTAATWYWELLDKYNGYSLFKPLRDFSDMIPWCDSSFACAEASEINVGNSSVRAVGYKGSDYAYLWLYDTRYTQDNKAAASIVDMELAVKNLKNGSYKAEWINTYTGEIVLTAEAVASDGMVTVSAPTWSKDLAVAITAE